MASGMMCRSWRCSACQHLRPVAALHTAAAAIHIPPPSSPARLGVEGGRDGLSQAGRQCCFVFGSRCQFISACDFLYRMDRGPTHAVLRCKALPQYAIPLAHSYCDYTISTSWAAPCSALDGCMAEGGGASVSEACRSRPSACPCLSDVIRIERLVRGGRVALGGSPFHDTGS